MFIILEIGCKMINHQNISSSDDPGHDGGGSSIPIDRFGEVIGYDNNTDNIGGTQSTAAQYSGNISWLMYNMSGVVFYPAAALSKFIGRLFL